MHNWFFDLENIYSEHQDDDYYIGEQMDFDFYADKQIESEEKSKEIISSEPQTCNKCENIFPYAKPNQKDGTFKCYSCRIWG